MHIITQSKWSLLIKSEVHILTLFLKIDTQNWLWLKKTKNNLSLTYIIEDLNGEEVVGTFYEKEL